MIYDIPNVSVLEHEQTQFVDAIRTSFIRGPAWFMQVFADKGTTLELRALNLDQSYAMAVEAFNEVGVSGLSAVRPVE